MNREIAEYFRCPEQIPGVGSIAGFDTEDQRLEIPGYFKFGDRAVCYGSCSSGPASVRFQEPLYDAHAAICSNAGHIRLPFDFAEIVRNLRQEEYTSASVAETGLARRLYYALRPILPVPVRKHLQKVHLRDWQKIPFPRWPVESSVDALMQAALTLILKNGGIDKIPLVWFWPHGAQGCAMMTHDVETVTGRDAIDWLTDVDESFGIKSAFQLIPEVRYEVSENLLAKIRRRGFEVNVHDLNHDGALFQDKQEFLRRAAKINTYIAKFQSQGFRAGAMYRKQSWFDAFNCSYDMSVPNVAHLEPQRGGCCTVMPYFIGKILELPMTTTQDYSLFHILNDYSIELWKSQIGFILENKGLITVGCHPDYLIDDERAQAVYSNLLAYLKRLGTEKNVWLALPGEVNRWWRERSEMVLVAEGPSWRVQGPGSDRARIAYASLDNGRLSYSLESSASRVTINGRSGIH